MAPPQPTPTPRLDRPARQISSALSPAFSALLEGLRLGAPEPVHVLQPLAKLAERFPSEAVNSNSSIVLMFVPLDQPGFSKDAQVSAHRWRTHRQRFGELSRASRLSAQQLDRRAPVGISERGEGAIKRAILHRPSGCECAA